MSPSARALVLAVTLGGLACREEAADVFPSPPYQPSPAVDAGPRPSDASADAPPPRVTGRWAMFHFEDPIAIDLLQNGPALSGMGCGAGLPLAADPSETWRADFCGPITGTFAAGRLSFAFPADDFKHVYRLEATVAANGRRMTGRIVAEDGTPSAWAFAWLPIGQNDQWLRMTRNMELSAAATERSGSYELAPVGAPPTDLDEASRSDRLWLWLLEQRGGAMVTGSLGSFCADEMTWDPATETLVAGPVPPTVPGLPIQLVLTFAGRTLGAVEATMPSGAVHRFQVVSRTP